jgi:hypothetical protein
MINGVKIVCENVVDDVWHTLGENFTTCQMEKTTRIDGKYVSIASKNDSILGLSFYTNKNIFYLPVYLAGSFPNLIAYDGSECSIREISKANFAGLTNLKSLALVENEIVKIFSNTFEDLVELEYLWLCEW